MMIPSTVQSGIQAFTIFYMCINVGAMFAPTAAEAVNNFVLKAAHFTYDSRIPALLTNLLKTGQNVQDYLAIAQLQDTGITLET